MKTKIKFAVAGLAVLSVIFLAACKGGGPSPAAGGAGGDQAKAEKTSSESEKTIYHCPMHPTVTSDKPGEYRLTRHGEMLRCPWHGSCPGVRLRERR